MFDGENANGTWVLNVSDNAGIDTGSLRRFSLIFNSGNTPEEAIPARVPNAESMEMENPPVDKSEAPARGEKGILWKISSFLKGGNESAQPIESGWGSSAFATLPVELVNLADIPKRVEAKRGPVSGFVAARAKASP
jgi:hypothetical protein